MEQPWKLAREGLPEGVGSSKVVTKENMAIYYGGL